MQEYCPLDDRSKTCAMVGSDVVNALGTNIPKPLPFQDVIRLLDMSDTILYNKGETMMGMRHTLAVDVSNSGSWIRFNVRDGDVSKVESVLRQIGCK